MDKSFNECKYLRIIRLFVYLCTTNKMNLKKIAAITMVRNDDFFLRKWVEYYGRVLGKENLYIYYDGEDQTIADFCDGTNAFLRPRIGSKVVAADKGRVKFLSEKAAELFAKGFDLVIGVDADEYIVVDPRLGISLRDFLSTHKVDVCLSPLGLDFGQKLGVEGDLSFAETFLGQRHYAQIGTRYTKSSIIAKPCQWGSGFHRVKGHNFHIARDLYLLHFGYADKNLLEQRLGVRDEQGWEKHIYKRSRTIRYVTEEKARDFERWTCLARTCQTWCRPPYALNKPAMFELRIVVKIPERFRNIL